MEARDFGTTVTLYMPQPAGTSAPHVVFKERTQLGTFPSHQDALEFARTTATQIIEQQHVAVRMRVEDESGNWTTCDPLALKASSEGT